MPNEYGFEPYTPPNTPSGDNYGFEPYQAPPQKQWWDYGVEGALDFVLPTAAMLGSALATEGMSLPASAGIGAAASAAGNTAKQWYDQWRGFQGDFDYGQAALSGTMGAVPGGFSSKLLGKTPGLARTVASGAIEGFGLGAASTIPQSYMETGKPPSLSEMGMGGLGAIPYGIAGGAIAHGAHAMMPGRPSEVIPPDPNATLPGDTTPPPIPPPGGATPPIAPPGGAPPLVEPALPNEIVFQGSKADYAKYISQGYEPTDRRQPGTNAPIMARKGPEPAIDPNAELQATLYSQQATRPGQDPNLIPYDEKQPFAIANKDLSVYIINNLKARGIERVSETPDSVIFKYTGNVSRPRNVPLDQPPTTEAPPTTEGARTYEGVSEPPTTAENDEFMKWYQSIPRSTEGDIDALHAQNQLGNIANAPRDTPVTFKEPPTQEGMALPTRTPLKGNNLVGVVNDINDVPMLYAPNPMEAIRRETNLNVASHDVANARYIIANASQDALRQQFPDGVVTAYRGMTNFEGSRPTVSLTLDPQVAESWAKQAGTNRVVPVQVRIEDVYGYSEAIGARGREIIVPTEVLNRTTATITDRPSIVKALPAVEQPARRPDTPDPTTLKNQTAQNWAEQIVELDAQNAPDIRYSDMMSTLSKNSLKKGETWRSRALDAVRYFEEKEPPSFDEPAMEKTAPGRAFRSNPLRPDLGPRDAGQGKFSITGDMSDAATNQSERARALGIDPTPYNRSGDSEALGQAIHNELQRRAREEPSQQARQYRPVKYDPRIGADSPIAAGNFKDYVGTASDEELQTGVKQLKEQMQQFRTEAENNPNVMQVVRRAKAGIAQAFDKVRKIEDELMQREYDRGGRKREPSQRDEPSMARVKGGGYTASLNDMSRMVNSITREYTGKMSGIMVREAGQNAGDAAERLGMAGEVRVRVVDDKIQGGKRVPAYIEMHDNGSGLDDNELANRLFAIFETGKQGEAEATGGKGIGSAAYIFGGKHFEIDTVSVDKDNVVTINGKKIHYKGDGKKYRIIASGSPTQFMDMQTGSDFKKVQVPMSTPTGTTIKIHLKDDQQTSHARVMLDNIIKHSRNKPHKIIEDRYGLSTDNSGNLIPVSQLKPGDGIVEEHKFKTIKNDKVVADFTYNDSEVKIQLDPTDMGSRNYSEVHYLNNGMYQYSGQLNYGKMVDDAPKHIIVDIHPLVDEEHDHYPFINTREHMKSDIADEIKQRLEESIKGPAVEKRKNRTQELYDSMTQVQLPGFRRKVVIFDPGNRLTADEMQRFAQNPTVHALLQHYDYTVDRILRETGRQNWYDRVEAIGISFGSGHADVGGHYNGIHIPNPSSDKSMILFAPFYRIRDTAMSTWESAWRGTGTALHEVAHVGTEKGTAVKIIWRPEDIADPRITHLHLALNEQIHVHGDVDWTSTGHGMDFAHRLSEVYSSFGVENTFDAAQDLHAIYTAGNLSGGYSPEIQDLLQLHQESRGRAATTEDILSGTGVKQANRGQGAAGGIPGDNQGYGGGTTPPIEPPGGRGRPPGEPPVPPDSGGRIGGSGEGEGGKKTSTVKQWFNLSRAATTFLDLSAPLRQGLTMITRKEWWKSWNQQIRSLGSEEAFQKSVRDLQDRAIAQRMTDRRTGKEVKSFLDLGGIGINDGNEYAHPTKGEESIVSNWIETGEMLAKIPGAQKTYAKTIGTAARATNRAYIAFLNQLRVDSFETLVKEAHVRFEAKLPGAKNPYTDVTFLKQIGDYVNTATGRGPLKMALPSFHGGLHVEEKSFEHLAKTLTDFLFSPRLLAAHVRMLNPMTYMMADPFVRKQYLRSMIGLAGTWGTMVALAKGTGIADVTMDPRSADFGKLRIGNTRLDPAGGFQQHMVAAARLISGQYISSSTGEEHEMGAGYQATTQKDIGERFMANKLHPVWKFAYDLANASEYQPFPVMDRTLQMFIPLIVGDVIDIAKEDPTLLPWMAPLVGIGMGTQTYGKGEAVSKFIPKENDINLTNFAPFEWVGLQNKVPPR